jgi:undecaprenyl pyrophosphate synthase
MNIDDIGYASGKVIKRVDELARTRKDLVSHVRAKSDAVRAGKDFYIADNKFVNRDIGDAVRKYADDLEDSPLSPDQLSKKSLQQLLNARR